jgi:uncharacterized membrane protein
MTEPPAALPDHIRRSRFFVLLFYYALIAYFGFASMLSFDDLTLAAPAAWLIQILPLLLFLPGLRRGYLRGYFWLSFLVMLYFCHAVLVAFDPARRWLGLIDIALCSGLFIFLACYIRQFRRHYGVNL